MLLGCTIYWESCHAYFLYMICYAIFDIIIDLHLQDWIKISLFELSVTWIESHVFVSNLSISHVFIYIIKFSCCLLLLGKIINLNIKHSKTCNQHHLYTIFKKIQLFSCFIFIYTHIQWVTLTIMEGVFIFHLSAQEDTWILYVPKIRI